MTRLETELEERVAKAKKLKQEPFEWDKIKRFFQLSDKTSVYQVISDRTCQDLDLDELFMFIDRTSSKVGQQMLYATLRTLLITEPSGWRKSFTLSMNTQTLERLF
jgi:hypothetical protein